MTFFGQTKSPVVYHLPGSSSNGMGAVVDLMTDLGAGHRMASLSVKGSASPPRTRGK